MQTRIPVEVQAIAKQLADRGFAAYFVGGCVRDLFLNRMPKDWDIATDAKPEEIQKVFPESVYENQFGTVGVKIPTPEGVGTPAGGVGAGEKIDIVEVTTFRLEGKYSDKRHPDEIRFAEKVEDDLSRRDFTVNAIAMGIRGEIVDPFGGKRDLDGKIIRTVGQPEDRFDEDALRLMRAVRFAVELGFEVDLDTRRAIEKKAGLLAMIAKERIRDEFVKMLLAPRAADGIVLLEELNLLLHVVPELREGLGVGQNKHHIYTVFEHNVRALDYTAKKDYSLEVRLASLLHDVGKPRTKRGEGVDSTFYNHEIVGAKMTAKALDNLRFSKEFSERVTHLVRCHLFYYNVGEVTPAGVRRFLARVGPENVDDLLKVREADRIGSGVPKAFPYKLRHLLFMIEKVKQDPVSPKMLKVRGDDVMEIAEISPGPKVGQILSALLEEVLDDPGKNREEYLRSRIRELSQMGEKGLGELARKAKERKEEFESGVEEEMKKKYYVQ
ncbi:HD domain-containing protein [Candidatus Parcubacteria bacterium]|nr:MAG: HD domain-containing protein [Candidatus Parcubacteria bacterium]